MDFKIYKVLATDDVESDLDQFIRYLLNDKMNEQAARNLIVDYQNTIQKLANVAGSLKLDDDPKCAALGYRRIHSENHRYFLMYRVENDIAIIDRMFHDLQDYRNYL